MIRAVVVRVLVVAVIAAYPAMAFHPYRFQLPERVENGAALTADGTAVFAREGMLRTAGPPAWLEPAIAGGRVSIILDVVPGAQARATPARILAISEDRHRSNLAVSQLDDALVMRVRTAGTGFDAEREVRVPGTFARGRRTHVNLRIFPAGGRARLEVRVNGLKKATARLPHATLAAWSPGYRLALGNELSGNRPWLGTVHRATVRAGPSVAEYTAAGALARPARYWKVANDPVLQPFAVLERRDVLLNLLGFVPLGMLVAVALWRRRGRIGVSPTLVALAASFALETGQLLVPGRSPALLDLILNTFGGLIGGVLVALAVGLRARAYRRFEADPI